MELRDTHATIGKMPLLFVKKVKLLLCKLNVYL